MKRTTVFLDENGGIALTMPVMPSEYKVTASRASKTVTMALGGEALLLCGQQLAKETQTYWLPARENAMTEDWRPPNEIVAQLKAWQKSGAVLHYLVPPTEVDEQVVLTGVRSGEEDGTCDVYVEVTFHAYRALEAEQTSLADAGASGRADGGCRDYIVQNGDTLRSICRAYYADEDLCYKLAGYNGLKNADLILPGDVLKLPGKEALASSKEVYGSLNGYKPPSTYVGASSTSGDGESETQSGGFVKVSIAISGTAAMQGAVKKIYYYKTPGRVEIADIPCTISALKNSNIRILAEAKDGFEVSGIRVKGGAAENFISTTANGNSYQASSSLAFVSQSGDTVSVTLMYRKK